MSIVSLTAARSSNSEVKAALGEVRELVYRHARVAQALMMPQSNSLIDAAAYLRELSLSVSRSKLDRLHISLVLEAPPLPMAPDRCWRLGMIVHELITNSVRHAFGENEGEIRVVLSRSGSFAVCEVLDNGSAPERIRPGNGLKIIHELAKGLGGRFYQRFSAQGSKSILTFQA